MNLMKAFAVSSYKAMGQLDHLQEVSITKPSAPAGFDMVVKVKAVATNPIDYKRIANLGNSDAPFELDHPLVVGWDASGIVEDVGPDVSLFHVGDEVMFAGNFGRAGTFAEYVAVDSRIVGKKPTSLGWSKAAALPLTSLTAWESLIDQLKIPIDKAVNKDKTILITSGAGGVGSMAVQIAKHVLGLTVIGSASREETRAFTKARGADMVVSHREKYAPQLEKLGVPKVDYVMHCSDLTPELFEEFADIVKPFGGIACIWPAATVDLMQLFWKSINFSAELMFTRPGMDSGMERQNEILNEVSRLVDEGVLTSAETATKSLTVDGLRDSLTAQASGKTIGKMTLSFP